MRFTNIFLQGIANNLINDYVNIIIKLVDLGRRLRTFIIKLVLILVPTWIHAISLYEQDIVTQFWILDRDSSKIQSEVSDWAEKYETARVISALDSEQLLALGKRVYLLMEKVQRLKRKALDSRREFQLEQSFADLYDIPVKFNRDNALPLLIATLADLVMYEQLAFWFHLASVDSTLIKRLNEIIIFGKKDHFDRLQKAWMRVDSRKIFARNLKLIEQYRNSYDLLQSEGSVYMISLRDRLDTHLAEEIRRSATFWGRLGQYILKAQKYLKLRASSRLNWMEYHLSKIFGYAAGAMNIQIFMDSIPITELERLKAEVLQPGDILIEKTAGAITDKLIPGHFGHVAIYLGNPSQLTELRLSDGQLLVENNLYKRYQSKIVAGKNVLDVVRPGVHLEDISAWRVTDLAIVRPVNYPKRLIADSILQSLTYVKTKYDFAFDVNTRSIVMCSELPYQSFKGIDFRTADLWGRRTLGPDDVAVLVSDVGPPVQDRPFQLIYFNHKTKEVPASKRFTVYRDQLHMAGSRYDEVPRNDLKYESF